ncbi:MAG: hypothetical protein QF386_06410, partial [Alphaproteobacteria bacterium]|nr:hypothetical protein [Alphaproteobacteria bacterium]
NMANGANVAVRLGAFKFCLRHGSVPSNNLNKKPGCCSIPSWKFSICAGGTFDLERVMGIEPT